MPATMTAVVAAAAIFSNISHLTTLFIWILAPSGTLDLQHYPYERRFPALPRSNSVANDHAHTHTTTVGFCTLASHTSTNKGKNAKESVESEREAEK